ncbi:zinc finger MYM-type protein 1-like [Centruroides vittatus]|uniref:zinc finger MYM-type protein 1-like n=1 Tax=Centruroides vittatus TaxID=120091 RepID=UPI0035108C0F
MSDNRKRLSGAQYRKRKREKEELVKKASGSLETFLISTTSQEAPSSSQARDVNVTETEFIVVSSGEKKEDSSNTKTTMEAGVLLKEQSPEEVSFENENLHVHEDPNYWPGVLLDKIKLTLIELGPTQLTEADITFPLNKYNRGFSSIYYKKKLCNGEIIPRVWLVYSKSKDCVYCFPCKIFKTFSSGLVEGYNDWRHLSQVIERHEKSKGHICNTKSWIDLKQSISSKTTTDSLNEKLINMEKDRWVSVLKIIIYVVKFLAGQNLSFRGENNKIYEQQNGNFLKLIETIANFNDTISDHINRIRKTPSNMPHYLGVHIQNELISLLGEKIRHEIISMLKASKYFSIILDSTPDVSHKDQLTVVVRFVLLNNKSKQIEIREHFLGFISISDSTGQGLTNVLLDFLETHNICLGDLRGQGYDNGANMKGRNNGLQKKILELNPRAFYVPCAAHSLNLVVNDAAKASLEITNFFAIVQELYVFFSASTKRWQVLKDEIPTLSLKPFSSTRWESRIDALKVLRYNLAKIYDALFALYSDNCRDPESRNMANLLLLKIKSFKFICSIITWNIVLTKINIASKVMQESDSTLPNIVLILEQTKTYLSNIRSNEGFNDISEEAKKIADDIDCDPSFPPINIVRPRTKKRLFDYECEDEAPKDPADQFKINFYFVILDTALSKLEERFEQIKQHDTLFNFLNNLYNFLQMDKSIRFAKCKALENSLCDPCKNQKDILAQDLYDEIDNVAPYISSEMNALNVINYLFTNNLIYLFPNLVISIRIFLTLPVTVASGEAAGWPSGQG